MPDNDRMYGSQYRPQQPISKRLSVQQGESRPSRTKQQATHTMFGLTAIQRGDRSGTIWARKVRTNTSFGNVQSLDDSLEADGSE